MVEALHEHPLSTRCGSFGDGSSPTPEEVGDHTAYGPVRLATLGRGTDPDSQRPIVDPDDLVARGAWHDPDLDKGAFRMGRQHACILAA